MAMKKNQKLASTLLGLAEEAKPEARDETINPELKRQLDELEGEIELGKSRWIVLKSVIGAVIAGSGIDWARDERLRELVKDDGEGEPVSEV